MSVTVAAEPKTLRLHRLEISNFMRVTALSIDAEGRHVAISGPNGSGKTSAVEAIWAALKGHSAREMPEPIHTGAAKASVKLELGEYTVERRWTDKSTSLIVTAADGSRIAKPQQLLDGLLGKYALDPLAFLARRPQDQVDDVLGICGVAPPVERVREITGEEHPAKPGESAASYLERLSADDNGLFYLRRRDAGNEAKRCRHALEKQRTLLEELGGPLTDEEPASASELLSRIDALQQQADARRQAEREAEDARRLHIDRCELLGKLLADGAKLDSEIAALEKQLAEAKAKRVELSARIDKGQEIIRELEADRGACDKALAGCPDPSAEISQLRRQVQAIEATNEARLKRASASERLDQLANETEHADAVHKGEDDILAALRHERRHLLNGVDLGIPGLEIGDGELLKDGVSFVQASDADRFKTACAIGMRQKPQLRLLRVDGGEKLDRHSREFLFNFAHKEGFQVVFTAVADTEQLQVEIVGG